MNIDDQYSTLLLIMSIQRFQNTFSAITTPTPTCYLFLLKNFFQEGTVSVTLFTRLRRLSLYALKGLHCRAARIIFDLPKDMPSTEVLDRAKWDTLRNTYKLSILKLIYKIYHNDSPSCMARLVTKFQHSYNFRKKHLLILPSFNTNSMKLSTSCRGAVLWNLLPRECHEAISLRSFMKMMNTSNIIKNTDFNNLYCKSS